MIVSLKAVQSRQREEELRPKQETCPLNSGALQERERQQRWHKKEGLKMANSGKDYCGGFQLEKQSTEEGNQEHILCSGFTHGPSSSTQQMRETRRIWR